MPRASSALILRDGDRPRLMAMTREPSEPGGLATRARIILLAADDVPNTDIARRVGVTRQTVVSWRERYDTGGITALKDVRRPGRPPVHDEVAVVVATLQPPPAELGVTRWTSRLLAEELGLSFATVARLWRKWNLQPWQVETFAFSTDPELATTVRDIVGVYLDPTQRAVIVRLTDELPDDDSAPRGVDAAADLLAALEQGLAAQAHADEGGSGRRASAQSKRRDGEFLTYLRAVVKAYPRALLHVVVDHEPEEVGAPLQAWLARNKRVTLHGTQTPREWHTIAHILFGIVTRSRTPAVERVGSLELARAVDRFLDGWTARSTPFRWIATGTSGSAAD